MEFKTVWMGYECKFNGSYIIPNDSGETKKAVNEISKLLKAGWKIVSTVAINGSITAKVLKIDEYHTYTYTSGIEVFLVKE
jgi:hypothetical protein